MSSIFPQNGRAVVIRFIVPPLIVCLAWLLVRWGIQNSLWSLILVWPPVACLCGTCAFLFAIDFALRPLAVPERWRRDLIRLGLLCSWIVGTGIVTIAGMALVEALPFRIGDGP
ncbi:MAG: hypothetical protein AB1705_25595 [Verrucomicrobiota bacterium]